MKEQSVSMARFVSHTPNCAVIRLKSEERAGREQVDGDDAQLVRVKSGNSAFGPSTLLMETRTAQYRCVITAMPSE